MIDSSILDSLITGRIDPQIYAFSTNTIPNYLKVGDSYRPVSIRLNEWRKYFPDLIPLERTYCARINDNLFFRDYSVHDFLIHQKHRERLLPEQANDVYYSNEFFKDAIESDIEEAIDDIKLSAEKNDGRYHFYDNDRLPANITPIRNQDYEPRWNQQKVIDKFKIAVSQGRKHLLMYAVMRFGKTFTTMCCANEENYRFVTIVSAKADVCSEWRNIIERHVLFENYVFLDREQLDRGQGIIPEILKNGKNIALFLTLQDLQGDEIKTRHQDVFTNHIDLVVVDETHFGARAEEYGRVLRNASITNTRQLNSELQGYDCDCSEDSAEYIKTLGDQETVYLHLSGTPYRILMGNEFEQEDIIAFVRFADIVAAQKAWDEENFLLEETAKEGNEKKEWDNPYFGFPQMIRFAFNPSNLARQKLQELKSNGVSYAMSALFKTGSISANSSGSHRKFLYESEVLDLFKVIDGVKKDPNILGFLNDSRIKEGHLCSHIVCVLPYRASCDALDALISKHISEFINWKDYTIINVAGHDTEIRDIRDLKNHIEQCEQKGKKTLTLTVNRFLTGSTVEQWDTMLYFKDTSSPQEYDQAIFRLQSPFITTYVNGDQIIKYNMKPQTLLVDFDPDRLFRLQELKSLFYNTNSQQRGNDELRKCIEYELSISPIIAVNHDRMQEITPQDIVDAVRNYNANKSILDEAIGIPFDKVLLEIDDLKEMIAHLKPLKDRKGIELEPALGDGVDLDVPKTIPNNQGSTNSEDDFSQKTSDNSSDPDDLEKKMAAYYMRILFYAFLADDQVNSLYQIIQSIEANDNNKRIAQHVGIQKKFLQLIFDNASSFKLSNLDCTIENVNTLGRDSSLSPIERANRAMQKLSRISESEVVTPQNVATDMVELIDAKNIKSGTVVLDLSSKQGELTYAFHKKYCNVSGIEYYSIATSKLTYELTRKVYKALEIPEEHVLNFTSFALIGDNNSDYIDKIKSLSPDIVLSAPPYTKTDGGGRSGSGSGSAIYHNFYNITIDEIHPNVLVMYLKANWYSGGRGSGLSDFREQILADDRISVFHDYPDPKIYIESDVNLRGGVCLFAWEKSHRGKCDFYNHINNSVTETKRKLLFDGIDYSEENVLIRLNDSYSILRKVQEKDLESISEKAFSRNPFRLPDKPELFMNKTKNSLHVYLPKGKEAYIYPKDIPDYNNKVKNINSWKVLVAKASPGEDKIPHAVISTPILSEPGSLCTDSHLLVRIVRTKKQAENLAAYMKTRFFRFMMYLAKNDQNMTQDVFRFVPVVDLNKKWNDRKLYRLFGLTKEECSYIDSIVTEPRQ